MAFFCHHSSLPMGSNLMLPGCFVFFSIAGLHMLLWARKNLQCSDIMHPKASIIWSIWQSPVHKIAFDWYVLRYWKMLQFMNSTMTRYSVRDSFSLPGAPGPGLLHALKGKIFNVCANHAKVLSLLLNTCIWVRTKLTAHFYCSRVHQIDIPTTIYRFSSCQTAIDDGPTGKHVRVLSVHGGGFRPLRPQLISLCCSLIVSYFFSGKASEWAHWNHWSGRVLGIING